MAKRKKVTNKFERKQNSNFIYRNFLIAIDYLKEIKNYIWFSSILFFFMGIIGYLFPIFFVDSIRRIIEELIKQTEGLDLFGLIRFIMVNNMQSALMGMILGIFFAIIPFGILIVNGYILGFVANKSIGSEGILVLWRLLPHGIFEIPAIMISVALGIRLGMFLFVYKERNKAEGFWNWIVDSIRVFVFIVIPLLVIAGIIEGLLIWTLG